MALSEKISYMPISVGDIGDTTKKYTIPVVDSPKLIQFADELDFAISAGDREFSPAVKLILREAMELIYNPHKYTPSTYNAALNSIKFSYHSLLDMPTKHPIATQLRMRFKRHYADGFWALMQRNNMIKRKRDYDIVASDGNITKNSYFIAKRIFDVVMATIILAVFSPVLLVTMVLIKIDSPGPVFFTQKRVGAKRIRRAGMTVWEPTEFDFYKLRSMYTDADESVHKEYIEKWMNNTLVELDVENSQFKMKDDPRITPVGRFIRKTSIDELPQLVNVIKGDMSLVGPRPVPVYEVEGYQGAQYERLASVPGITGLWQIKGRGRTTLDEQVQMDVSYIYQQSFWRDFEILLNTPSAVIKGTGAH